MRRPLAPPSPTAANAIGWLGSAVFHLVFAITVGTMSAVPEIDIEFSLPAEVEFGVTEEMMVQAGQTAPIPEPEPEPPLPLEESDDGTEPALTTDAGVPEPEPEPEPEPDESEPEPEPEAEAEPEPPAVPVAASILEGPSRIPPGAQLALRLDMARIRDSVLAPDVRRLLAAIPDWHLILDGSNIDPIEDLDRVFIASPNLQRSRVVIAGRHTRDGAFVEAAVARIASARGVDAPWGESHGVRTAPWANRDSTDRELAILGPRHFAITRPSDLPRLLAVAEARRQRDSEAEGLEQSAGPDALLSMGPEEGVSLEIEGVARFIRNRPPSMPEPPERLRAAITQVDPSTAALTAMLLFADEAEASAAAEWLERLRRQQLGNLFVRMSGMDRPLRSAEVLADGDRVRVHTNLDAQQVRLIFGYIEGALNSRRRRLMPPEPEPSPEAAPEAEVAPAAEAEAVPSP